jgi:hypothetical protein
MTWVLHNTMTWLLQDNFELARSKRVGKLVGNQLIPSKVWIVFSVEVLRCKMRLKMSCLKRVEYSQLVSVV